jgi:hypothetical protein
MEFFLALKDKKGILFSFGVKKVHTADIYTIPIRIGIDLLILYFLLCYGKRWKEMPRIIQSATMPLVCLKLRAENSSLI